MEKYNEIYKRLERCTDFEKFAFLRKKSLIVENDMSYKGSRWSKGRKVGPNELVGGQTSACSEFLVDDRIIAVDSSLDSASLKIGDIDDVYVLLFRNLVANKMKDCTLDKLAKFISLLCDYYFGPNYDYNGRKIW